MKNNRLTQGYAALIPRENRFAYALIGLWVLSMIALPIALWVFGERALPIGTNVAALFQASAVFVLVQRQWGWQGALRAFALVAIITWGAEVIGHRTGFPFGDYHYTERLQPQLAGVPLLIPVAWFMLLPPSWALAQHIVGAQETLLKRGAFILLSAAALTAWDLFLDPQMVGWDFWQWAEPSGYFGIPWQNYAGWLLVASLVTVVVNPRPLPLLPLALIYGVVWFLQSIGQALFWGQPGPAFFGSLAMGSILALAYWRSRKRRS